MLKIAHRGNMRGPHERENEPNYIDEALSQCHVEIDLRMRDGQLYLGHDHPTYHIDIHFLVDRLNRLWIHCKDIDSLDFCMTHLPQANYFWHQTDAYTITSKGYIWCYPGSEIPRHGLKYICVMPEHGRLDDHAYGVCSDYIL